MSILQVLENPDRILLEVLYFLNYYLNYNNPSPMDFGWHTAPSSRIHEKS